MFLLWKKFHGLLGAHRRQLWLRGFNSAPRTVRDGMAQCGTVLPAPALPFHKPDFLLLHHSASLPTLLLVAHWVGNGVLMFLFSAGMLHFEVGMCDFHLFSMVGCREKLKPKLLCLRHFSLLGTKLEELNSGKKTRSRAQRQTTVPQLQGTDHVHQNMPHILNVC